MTEQDWLESSPKVLLQCIRGTASSRQFRLFCCASARQLWHLLSDENLKTAIALCEEHVDGRRSRDFHAAVAAIPPATRLVSTAAPGCACFAVDYDRKQKESAFSNAWFMLCYAPSIIDPKSGEAVVEHILRDVFGASVYHDIHIDPACLAWRDETPVKLAGAAYEERAFPSGQLDATRLALLADALEEGGCTAEEVLAHLRSAGPHYRGCWCVDLCLRRQ